LAAVWTPDVLAHPGKPPVRGFGGRFYFYNEQSHAVPVEGQLVVYAYDDSNEKPSSRKTPDRKYAFTPEQFAQHFGETQLGASYSIWIPWDEVGGQQKNISLLPVFTSTSGRILMGQQALNVLPGKQAQPEPASKLSYSAVRPASHQTSEVPGESGTRPRDTQNSQRTLRTTTIPLTRSMCQRLMTSRAAPTLQPGATALPAAGGAPTRLPYLTPAPSVPPPTPLPPYAAPTATVPESPPAPTPADQVPIPPSAHSGRLRFPVPRGPNGQSGRAGLGWRQHPATPQFAHPFSPQPRMWTPNPESSANGVQTVR
jgi:hypothetical protein